MSSADLPGNFTGMRVTVMGLGLHGGGLAAALYLANRGADVTVTDLRSADVLAPVLARLPSAVATVLGEHREEDFRNADLVVKNPAVPRTAPLLQIAPAVTTDIALFLARWRDRLGEDVGPLVAITGTKGKSTTSAATAHILRETLPGTRLGGNITVSPLTFVEELEPGDPVVLELSSFQLGDLAYCRHRGEHRGGDLAPPLLAKVAVITTIFPDHQDYYGSMESYVRDKYEIFRQMDPRGVAIVGDQQEWSETLAAAARDAGAPRVIQGGRREFSQHPIIPGAPMRAALAIAAAAAVHLGVDQSAIRRGVSTFPGVPHRMEIVRQDGDSTRTLTWINDTAATIPEAALAAVAALEEGASRIVLIAGGSDKGLALAPLTAAAEKVVRSGGALVLLAGSATDRLIIELQQRDLPYSGPWENLAAAVTAARLAATSGDTPVSDVAVPERSVIVLSPGCASFGMFRNEFDRGDQFRQLVR